jgi:hypothetical protein
VARGGAAAEAVLLGFAERGAGWEREERGPRGRWPLAAGRGGAGAARGEVGRFASAGLRGATRRRGEWRGGKRVNGSPR